MRIILFFLLLISSVCKAQVDTDFKLDAAKAKKFIPYLAFKHENFNEWKNNNKMLYHKELWYYTESFYVKRNYFAKGETLDESIIDISRFEQFRKETDESIVEIPGFKDAIVLIPNNKLIYKP